MGLAGFAAAPGLLAGLAEPALLGVEAFGVLGVPGAVGDLVAPDVEGAPGAVDDRVAPGVVGAPDAALAADAPGATGVDSDGDGGVTVRACEGAG